MEQLTELRFSGTDRVEAWCPGCKKWIQDVDVVQDCHPYKRDIIFCPICKTGLIRSTPIEEALCMNPHIHKVCDAECQIYDKCKARSN